MSSASVYTTYGACIEHIAPNVWAARGSRVTPGVLESFIEAHGGHRRPDRSTGWLDDGRPWFAFEIDATLLGSPAMPTPKDLKALLRGRDFAAHTVHEIPCGNITTDAGGSFIYGWGRFFNAVGADIGDYARASFDVVNGHIVLELGGPELLLE